MLHIGYELWIIFGCLRVRIGVVLLCLSDYQLIESTSHCITRLGRLCLYKLTIKKFPVFHHRVHNSRLVIF